MRRCCPIPCPGWRCWIREPVQRALRGIVEGRLCALVGVGGSAVELGGVFGRALFVVLICIAVVILRKQWEEHERFAFPIMQVPLAMGERRERGGWDRCSGTG